MLHIFYAEYCQAQWTYTKFIRFFEESKDRLDPCRRETIEEQSGSTEIHNQKEKEHRMRETRFAQIGAALLILGFAVQIAANVIYES